MSKQTRFARAFEPWIAEWSKAGLSGTQERVMLLLAANMERDEKGSFVTIRSRSEIAQILGMSEVTIRNAVKALARKGMIQKVGKAYNGNAQKYVLMPRNKGGAERVQIIDKGGSTENRKGVPQRSRRGTSTAPPIRELDSGSGSLSRPTAQENERQEAARRRYAERLRNVV